MKPTYRDIRLPNGSILELEIHDGFYEKIAQHFHLSDISSISDDHIRMFIFGATTNAIDKAEKEIQIFTKLNDA